MLKWLKKKRIVLVPLAGLLLGFLASGTPLATQLESMFYDAFMRHARLGAPVGNDSVVVIGIDDETLAGFEEPIVLWHRYFARVIQGVARAGARGIVLDMIFAISLDKLAPEMDRAFMEALRTARSLGTPVYLGFSAGKNTFMPHRKFLFFAGGLGFLNLYPDPDGKIRKQVLVQKDAGGRAFYAVSRLMVHPIRPVGTDIFPDPLYIDYRYPAPPVLSFARVYEALAPGGEATARAGQFKDKFVFIGTTTSKLQDIHQTPFKEKFEGAAYIPGVLIHALTTKTLLGQKQFKTTRPEITWALAVVCGLLAALLAAGLSPFKAFLGVCLIAAGIFGAAGYGFSHYVILNIVPAIFFLTANLLVTAGFRYFAEYRQFNSLKRYFKSYVNPEVMREIIENPDTLSFEGDYSMVTIMFTDIRGFTHLSEHMHPRELLQGLNRYFTEMTAAVVEVGGYLNRYLGDGILALFGAPNHLSHDGALAAVACGLDMLQRLKKLNRAGLFPGLAPIEIGIGIHTGEAIVGNIGCFEKMDYSVIGDTANLASRIESQTKEHPGAMLVSEATFKRIADRVNGRFVAAVKVKGRDQEVKLYEIHSLKEGL